MDGISTIPLVVGTIFTEQFLTFLSAVQIAINNDLHVKAKVTIAFSDLQKFIEEKDLSPGQIVSLLSTCIANIMQEKNCSSILDGTDSFC